jgi:hypothetical protein
MEQEWSHEDRITPGWRYTSRLHSLGNPESVDLTGNRACGNRGPLARGLFSSRHSSKFGETTELWRDD